MFNLASDNMITPPSLKKNNNARHDIWYDYYKGINYFRSKLGEGINKLTINFVGLESRKKKQLTNILPKYTVNILHFIRFRDSCKILFYVKSYCLKFDFREIINSSQFPLIKKRIVHSPCLDSTFIPLHRIKIKNSGKKQQKFLKYLMNIDFKALNVTVSVWTGLLTMYGMISHFLKRKSLTSLNLTCTNDPKLATLTFKEFLSASILFSLKKLTIHLELTLVSQQDWYKLMGGWFSARLSIKANGYVTLFQKW